MKENATTSQKEINDVELALKTAELSLKEARLDKQIAELKVRELESRLSKYYLTSPVNGIVEKLSIDKGE